MQCLKQDLQSNFHDETVRPSFRPIAEKGVLLFLYGAKRRLLG